jgi:hypothetical protein
MNIFTFPAKFVYWDKVKTHDKIKSKYYPRIIDHKNKYSEKCKTKNKSWNCDCITSFFMKDEGPNVNFEKDFFDEVIWNTFDEMLLNLNKSVLNVPIPIKSYVRNLWYNHYTEGMHQEIHTHEKNNLTMHYSGIYLLDVQEENTTVFVDNNNCHLYDVNSGLKSYQTKHIKEGNVIFFPAELMHFVNPCLKSRTTISFNIECEF